MYLHYLCISLNLTRPCCRLQRLNHINSFPESSYVYYCNTKIFWQVCKILLCFLFWARMTCTISIKMYQLHNCDLFLKFSASGSSEQELINDYNFFRLYHSHNNLKSHAVPCSFSELQPWTRHIRTNKDAHHKRTSDTDLKQHLCMENEGVTVVTSQVLPVPSSNRAQGVQHQQSPEALFTGNNKIS